MIAAIITVAAIAISIFVEKFCSILKILFTKPLKTNGAVEIDPIQHIYSHPEFTDQLENPVKFKVKTLYEILLHGLKISRDRPQFSFRSSSDEQFKSYTYK